MSRDVRKILELKEDKFSTFNLEEKFWFMTYWLMKGTSPSESFKGHFSILSHFFGPFKKITDTQWRILANTKKNKKKINLLQFFLITSGLEGWVVAKSGLSLDPALPTHITNKIYIYEIYSDWNVDIHPIIKKPSFNNLAKFHWSEKY